MLSMTQGCIMTVTQSHISKVKVTLQTYPKMVSGLQLLTAMLDLDNILHHCFPWPKGETWPWPKVISQRPRSQYTYSQHLCQIHNCLMSCLMFMIFITFALWSSLRVILPRSRSQFTQSENLFLGLITFHI